MNSVGLSKPRTLKMATLVFLQGQGRRLTKLAKDRSPTDKRPPTKVSQCLYGVLLQRISFVDTNSCSLSFQSDT
uniref:Ovule protein n=1 Tax=Parascaris univalens TaxID=6257 RepID=A0A915BBH2_PARUN